MIVELGSRIQLQAFEGFDMVLKSSSDHRIAKKLVLTPQSLKENFVFRLNVAGQQQSKFIAQTGCSISLLDFSK